MKWTREKTRKTRLCGSNPQCQRGNLRVTFLSTCACIVRGQRLFTRGSVNQFMSSIWEISLLFQFTSAHPRSSATTKIIFGCFSLLSCAYNSCMKKKINFIFNLECGYEGLLQAPINSCKFIDLLKKIVIDFLFKKLFHHQN